MGTLSDDDDNDDCGLLIAPDKAEVAWWVGDRR